MRRPVAVLFLASVATLAGLRIVSAQAPRARSIESLRAQFENPPDDARIMMRWWWFGPAVDKVELERELKTMRDGGIGGVEIQPVYPLALDDPEKGFKNDAYLSAEFLESVRFANERARALGMRVDITLGSGWPYGGPHIPVTEASSRLRVDKVAVAADTRSVAMPEIGAGEKLIAVFRVAPEGKSVSLDMLDRLPGAGVARLRLPEGGGVNSHVLFFIASRTGMQVKRPSIGAEGFVLDHLDRAALDRHLRVAGEPLLKAFGNQPPYAVFSDSLEVYGADWTGDFLAEFEKRRGYDLKPHLPALVENLGEESGAVRNDWGKTLTELVEERYLKPLNDWARTHGTRFRSQTYGTPPVSLSSNAIVDLAEGEGSNWRKFTSTRWATSANHLYGRTVTSSETWTWLHSPAFRATPLDMKAEADSHFLQGVNQLIGHGWPYSPESAGEPGYRFYAAAVFNHHNPWWIVMPDIAKYLQRISFLLRQGKPANDVAVYLPLADARAHATLGKVSLNEAMEGLLGADLVPAILDAGYNFDFIDDGAIEKLGISHKVLVVPSAERMPLGVMERIDSYAEKGGKVIVLRRLPSRAPGLREAESDTPRIREIAKKFTLAGDLKTALGAALAPDFAAPQGVGFVHRVLDSGDVYFVANTTNERIRGGATVRNTAGVQSWDPFTGRVSASGLSVLSGRHLISLDLAPYESRVFVFTNEAVAAPSASYPPTASVELNTNWRVTFGPTESGMEKLASWTDREATRFYSGTATYAKTFTISDVLAKSQTAILDFGEGTPMPPTRLSNGMRAWLESPVREVAQVYVNGKLAGSVWHPPYELNVTGLLKPGANDLRILVGNLAINALAGQSLPDYNLLHLRYGRRFDPQDMKNLQPLPAGILGPVTLRVRTQ